MIQIITKDFEELPVDEKMKLVDQELIDENEFTYYPVPNIEHQIIYNGLHLHLTKIHLQRIFGAFSNTPSTKTSNFSL